MEKLFQDVKRASKTLSALTDEQRNSILLDVAEAIVAQQNTLLAANAWSAWM